MSKDTNQDIDVFKDIDKLIIQATDTSEFEINGNKYTILKLTHRVRWQLFTYYTKILNEVSGELIYGNLVGAEFEASELLLMNNMRVNDQKVTLQHFEANPKDYIPFLSISYAAISNIFF